MNNFERIKQMTVDEMADFILEIEDLPECAFFDDCRSLDGCKSCKIQWLLEEYKDE